MTDIKDLILQVGIMSRAAYFFNICDPKAALVCSISTVVGYSFLKRNTEENSRAVLAGHLIGLMATHASGYDIRSNYSWFKLELATNIITEMGRIVVKASNNGLDPARIDPMP